MDGAREIGLLLDVISMGEIEKNGHGKLVLFPRLRCSSLLKKKRQINDAASLRRDET